MTKLKKLSSEDEFLKLDNLINDPDVNKAIEENCMNHLKDDFVYIEKPSVEYHKLKTSDLPMYRKYNAYKATWFYKFEIIDGKHRCLKIVSDELNGVALTNVTADNVLDKDNEDCTEHEWMLACAELLNYITPNTK